MKCYACGGEVDEEGNCMESEEEESKSGEVEIPAEVLAKDFVLALKERK